MKEERPTASYFGFNGYDERLKGIDFLFLSFFNGRLYNISVSYKDPNYFPVLSSNRCLKELLPRPPYFSSTSTRYPFRLSGIAWTGRGAQEVAPTVLSYSQSATDICDDLTLWQQQ